jgi:hypothetical protein
VEDSCVCDNELAVSISGGHFLTSGGCVSSKKAHAPELLWHVYVSNLVIFNGYFPQAVTPDLLTAQSGSMAEIRV